MTALATRWSLAVILIGFSLLTACRSSYPVPILLPYGTTVSHLAYPYPGAPYHEGVDIAGQVGDPILAVIDGSVIAVVTAAGDERCGLGVVTAIGSLDAPPPTPSCLRRGAMIAEPAQLTAAARIT